MTLSWRWLWLLSCCLLLHPTFKVNSFCIPRVWLHRSVHKRPQLKVSEFRVYLKHSKLDSSEDESLSFPKLRQGARALWNKFTTDLSKIRNITKALQPQLHQRPPDDLLAALSLLDPVPTNETAEEKEDRIESMLNSTLSSVISYSKSLNNRLASLLRDKEQKMETKLAELPGPHEPEADAPAPSSSSQTNTEDNATTSESLEPPSLGRNSSIFRTISSFLPEVVVVWPWQRRPPARSSEPPEAEEPAPAPPGHEPAPGLERVAGGVEMVEDESRLPVEIKFDLVAPALPVLPAPPIATASPDLAEPAPQTSKNSTSGFLGPLSFLAGIFSRPETADDQPPGRKPSLLGRLPFSSLFAPPAANQTTPSSPIDPQSAAAESEKEKPSAPALPVPSLKDLRTLSLYKLSLAVYAALHIQTAQDGEEFLKYIGLDSLLQAALSREPFDAHYSREDAVRGLCQLLRAQQAVAERLAGQPELIDALCDLLEAPLKTQASTSSGNVLTSFFSRPPTASQTAAERERREKQLRGQHEAVALVQRLVRTSDQAVEELRGHPRLKKILLAMVEAEGATPAAHELRHLRPTGNGSAVLVEPIQLSYEDSRRDRSYALRRRNDTTIVEYVGLRPPQMARVSLWGLGGVPWKPRRPGQKGLRILSFDGGGTRGVLSIALVRDIFERLHRSTSSSASSTSAPQVEPAEAFDLICGTSTGGILALLLGGQRKSIAEAEALYDELIAKIFAAKSTLTLLQRKAFYDERAFEAVLFGLCGDQLMLDTNQNDCPRVFCVSSKFNANPPATQIWRNYNHPPAMRGRYPGAFRVNTLTAVRATTAAPTFFTPVPWEGGLYCDGALVANNPTAIAIEEAKTLYPEVPIELVVSIGTGVYVEDHRAMRSMGWAGLVNQLVASSTDTEDTHALLANFLSPACYFRLNPLLPNNTAIDEKDPDVLRQLKQVAREHSRELFEGPQAAKFEGLLRTLRGQ